MPNVMEMRNLRNKPSYNGFDLSTNRLFTARAGEIIPVFCKIVMPGDKVELYPQHFTRTQPLNTAAYSRISEQVNFFKVRLHHLHNMFDTYVTSMFENQQVADSITSANSLSSESPYFTQYDLASLVHNLSVAKKLDELNYPIAPRVVKLLQYLGYGDYSDYVNPNTSLASTIPSRRLSPFPLLAYQKVYFDYFRYQQWETSSPWCFNINWATFGQSIGITDLTADDTYLDSMITPRYANFKKDYFLGVLPSPQYGDSSVVPVLTSANPTLVVGKNNGSAWDSITVGSVIGDSTQTFNSGVRAIVNNPSVLSIRKAEAIQKLREIQLSGNQDYKEQIEKIFGVTVPDNESDLCEWLGGYDSTIDISEVVNQSLNGDGSADIKGKGTSSNSGKISFESRDFSIIIGVYTAVPKLYYDVSVPRSVNTMVHIDDYPNPVLDRIGMETVMWNDIIGYGLGFDVSKLPFGYAPRYYKFKTNYDEVLGAFKSSVPNNLQSWVTPYSSFIERLDMGHGTSKLASNYLMFKVDPNILNPIFNSQIKKDYTSPQTMLQYYNEEQFLINMSIGDASVRPLDYDGLPYN